MTSNYKKLGQYIRQVSDRNSDLSCTNLQGVSITKRFIPSIANTIGTNMTTYKKVRRRQFAYGPVTSRNGDKISVALLDQDDAIISQAYTVFEIIDQNELDPEYLMMWFRRPEFDRYARFKSHGSVREIFGWDEMCDIELPVPGITEQKRVVEEYKTITNRIMISKQFNKKLEESAIAIYKHWFVDFAFPLPDNYANSIGKPEISKESFKDVAGQLTGLAIDHNLPPGWEQSLIGSEFKVTIGRTPPRHESEWFCKNCDEGMKWISIKDMGTSRKYISETSESLTLSAIDKLSIPIIQANTTILSFKMSVGKVAITDEIMTTNEAIAHMNIKKNQRLSSEYIYCFWKIFKFNKLGSTSSIVTSINSNMIKSIEVIVPHESVIEEFNKLVTPIFALIRINEKVQIRLDELSSSILARMAHKSKISSEVGLNS